MHLDFRFPLLRDQYKGSKWWAGNSISYRISRYINLKLTFSIVFVSILMFTFSNFQFIPNCPKLWHLKNQFFLLLHTACISPTLPLSLLQFTCDTHMVFSQWNVSQCVQIWILNISNIDSLTQTIYLWYKYYSKWICVSFSFQYIYGVAEKQGIDFNEIVTVATYILSTFSLDCTKLQLDLIIWAQTMIFTKQNKDFDRKNVSFFLYIEIFHGQNWFCKFYDSIYPRTYVQDLQRRRSQYFHGHNLMQKKKKKPSNQTISYSYPIDAATGLVYYKQIKIINMYINDFW